MHSNSAIFWIFICTILTVFGRRVLYDSKCTRKCNIEQGTTDCWKATTDGFAYGLSTAMIDFCQVILKIGNLPNREESWYNISRNILIKQIEQYELDDEVRQLTKENIEQIAVSLLDQCFNASPSISSSEPSCPLCSETQTKEMKKWRLSSIILIPIGLLFFFIVLLLYAVHTYHTRRAYVLI